MEPQAKWTSRCSGRSWKEQEMTVYAVASTKGGVGKTSTALHLATMLAKQ
ncbi:ParA family protein, partial [Xanthomonas euvesicatoria]